MTAGAAGSIPGLGAPVLRHFGFAFNSAGILTAGGCPLYVPTPGDFLLDAWIEVETTWDGTTPLADIGLFGAGKAGLFASLGTTLTLSLFADMTAAPSATATGLLTPNGEANFRLAQFGSSSVPGGLLPAKFASAAPICVCVSETGLPGGTNPVSTKGAANLYLVTVTPT